ncbi:type VI secretion system ATPase TssH [Vibrio nigripulchritudo]|uniref:type VI secretion system ATPase TssH n=1 Tax=Vibrio nigripulchritudo TaxID=28173 RepID=UPI0024902AC8|nr:type VI secretion system ATPase TssH [Vibrio nigripulchritudo]BDU39423.1 ClpV1 family T6SS ATPase [Vibrio nigripulchritudo]BDU45143.1 ClpV1 family T6SS ATPase [Vibrio nigripulchritudo]
MIRIELPTLISKLNDQSKLALEQAASLCLEHEHSEVTFEHYLHVLLDNPLSDVREILRSGNTDHHEVQDLVHGAFPRETGHDTYPVFSPLLIELLQDAWLLASTEMNLDHLRSGVIFLTAIMRPDRYLPLPLANKFQSLNRETLRREFFNILKDSSETPVEESTGKKSKAPIGNDGQRALDKYCANVTAQARNQELDPVLCRDEEINLMIDILCRRRKNNPIVVGDAGVGKSAVVEGLANRIVDGKVPDKLKNIELMSLDLGLLQAGAAVKGEFEKRLKSIIDEVKSSPTPIILFIDEAHTLIGAGNQEGGGDAANLLKPALARGELCAVAATTWKEYKKYFEKDPALSRRFQLVKLDEPSADQTVDILRGLCEVYEKNHQVLISDSALKAASHLSARYVSGRQLPDKAIDVLDTACARISINLSTPPSRMSELETLQHQYELERRMLERQVQIGQKIDEERLATLIAKDEECKAEYQETEQAWQKQRDLINEMIELRTTLLSDDQSEDDLADTKQALEALYEQLDQTPFKDRLIHPEVDEQQVAEVIADWTGVPIDQMNTDELTKLTHLPEILENAIKGQDVAINRIHKHLLTARADLRRPGRPKGAFLLVGPSGVGKTETVVQLAEELYGGKRFLTTINMSEYQEKHTVSRLIGSPPGYVGFGEGGVLTEAIRKMPYSVVLLDEVEKAHPEVLNLFYQAFDKGELADGEGRLIDCQNIVFFLTSNLGFQTIVDYAERTDEMDDALYPELAAFFKPALLARMETVPYLPLGEEVMEKIVRGKLSKLENTLTERYKATVDIASSVIEEILSRTTRSENGARMLEAIIEGQMLPPISLALLEKLANQETVTHIAISAEDGEFIGKVE